MRIAVIEGDGIGKEVIPEAVSIISRCSDLFGFPVEFDNIEGGAEYLKKTGCEWDEDSFERCKRADAVLLGAVGLPGVRLGGAGETGSKIIFGLRMGLDLYANVRPVKLYPGVMHMVNATHKRIWNEVDFVIVRENTEDLYTPVKGILSRGGAEELAVDTRIITRKGAQRVIDFGFQLALIRSAEKRNCSRAMTRSRRTGSGMNGQDRYHWIPVSKNMDLSGIKTSGVKNPKVTCVDKSNVMAGCRLFRQVFDEVSLNYSVQKECCYVDAFAMNIVRQPENYDVVVTSNLMGDILSDLGAALQGGLGMAPSGNIGDSHAVFEPVHGSAPDIAGKNVANPIGAILSASMMLEWVGEKRKDKRMLNASTAIEKAVISLVKKGKILPVDIGGNAKCTETGRAIHNLIHEPTVI